MIEAAQGPTEIVLQQNSSLAAGLQSARCLWKSSCSVPCISMGADILAASPPVLLATSFNALLPDSTMLSL